MKIGIADADLIGRKRHRFPNLVCMKLSGYYKAKGAEVVLKTDYDGLEAYDKVYIAKVFTDTPIPEGGLFENILERENVEYGGTGFYYDKAPALPPEIEHFMPDYNLYDAWLAKADKGGTEFKAYKEYSIGFLTRGCFRHCAFCVNRKYSKVFKHSPLEEFLDSSRRKICLLDDNFFGYEDWKVELKKLIETQKPFHFKQGLDVRLLDDEKAEMLFKAKYDGDYIFAFDDYKDAPIIEEKLKLIRRHTQQDKIKFYVLCGYDRRGKFDKHFFEEDLRETALRLKLLKNYKCKGYVMRYKACYESDYRQIYNNIASWTNQPQFAAKMPFTEFVTARYKYLDMAKVKELERIME